MKGYVLSLRGEYANMYIHYIYICYDLVQKMLEDSSLLDCPDEFPFCTWVKCELI